LKEARESRDAAKRLLANGIDPSVDRRLTKLAQIHRIAANFEVVALEWLEKITPHWTVGTTSRTTALLTNHVFPYIGGRPIAEVTPTELLDVLRRIEARGAVATAHRLLDNFGQIYSYAVATGRIKWNFTGDLRPALGQSKGKHFAAVTKPEQVAEVLRAIDGFKGSVTVGCALRLTPLVFLRPIDMRYAQWRDFDFDNAMWTFTKSKLRESRRIRGQEDRTLIVPLSRQSIEILRHQYSFSGRGAYVFPAASKTKGPLGVNSINQALRSVGISKELTSTHGFRATARTILNEVLRVDVPIIELQLGHIVLDPNGRAYNRTQFLPQRRKMMQRWADYLDKLRTGEEYIVTERIE
jgi:integrase